MQRKTLNHDEAVQEVYRLTPQIKDYDEFMYMGVRWLPYTMYFHHNNYRSKVINTDAFGFRYSHYKDRIVGVADFPDDQPVNLIVGGSTTMGTGTTSDAYTLASCLSKYTNEIWLNFGGRGYNAVQELLLFLMHQHRFKKINNVVVFSGVNTLSLEGIPDELATEHGRYYYSYEFNHYMSKYNDDLRKRKNSYSTELGKNRNNIFYRIKEVITKFLLDENPADKIITDDKTDTPERVQRTAWVIVNSLKQWKQLLAPFQANLYFALQPMSYWTRDFLTPEEQDIFHAIDSCPNNFWRLFAKILGKEIHQPFADAIQKACEANDIQFADMNVLLRDSPIINDYFFVDRVHFNDRGYDENARLVYEKVLI